MTVVLVRLPISSGTLPRWNANSTAEELVTQPSDPKVQLMYVSVGMDMCGILLTIVALLFAQLFNLLLG